MSDEGRAKSEISHEDRVRWAWQMFCRRWEELLSSGVDISRRARTLSSLSAVAEVEALGRSKLLARGETRQGELGERAGHGIHNIEDVVDEALALVERDPVLKALQMVEGVIEPMKLVKSSEFGDVELVVH